ncbi:cytidylyltransferase domain-containing protein [Azospirillum thermophilum]|uniref:Flagellar modification protein B n=1 Tax=Azospirillum thermophilum TaxID=2202148 RepID=A0A2S2D0G0_9PROT|nr:acylneuraminate cytidylyltransferase family protein [Azospirillum thermophilum]AWK90251.1 flagellar modification protein B [Azospirillum thermophilum]
MADRTPKRLCTICARGGSKGLPGKNIRPLLGRPLLAHSLLQARASGLFDAVAVSSDSPAILEVGRAWGADLLVERPAAMATDDAGKLPAIRHALSIAEDRLGIHFDTLVDLDCTSPLRLPSDIAGAVALLEESGAGNVITGTPARRSPYFNMVETGPDGAVRLAKQPEGAVLRRQDAPPCYDMNASIYVWNVRGFTGHGPLIDADTRLFVMPAERSVDIDAELDFAIVEFLMQRAGGPE